MDNEDQFEFEIIRDVYTDTIFKNDKVEPIYEEESLPFNEAFIPLEYARRVVETCKEHPKWSQLVKTAQTDFAKCLLKIVVSKKATILLQELLLLD